MVIAGHTGPVAQITPGEARESPLQGQSPYPPANICLSSVSGTIGFETQERSAIVAVVTGRTTGGAGFIAELSNLVSGEWLMANGTYHGRKLYIPKEVRERLGLADGDQTEIRVLDERSFTVTVERTSAPEERIAQRILERPFSFAVKTPIKREDYYEDHSRRPRR